MPTGKIRVASAAAMSRSGDRFPGRRLQGLAVLVTVLVLTGAHFRVAHATHGLHEIHIVLGGMYLIPITAAALWFGWGALWPQPQ